jgi:hypothetical protein
VQSGVGVREVPLPDVVSMQCRQPNLEGSGEIKLRRLVKEALRMRPSRIVVGEVRQEESLDLLIAPNNGEQRAQVSGTNGRLYMSCSTPRCRPSWPPARSAASC